jgi:hypothetical protein
MRAKFENVTIEEPKGKQSTKDVTKYYGSAILKYKDPETRKKESLEIKVNNPHMVQALEKYEMEETLLDVVIDISQSNFGVQIGEIITIDIIQ